MQAVCDGDGFPVAQTWFLYDFTQVFSHCHPPVMLKHLPLWSNWVRMMKYLEILACYGKEYFHEECL